MESILLWGITPVYEVCSNWIKERKAQNEINVVAIIDDECNLREFDGYQIIRTKEIHNYVYERIVITAGGTVTRKILQKVQGLKLNPDKVIKFADYELEYVTGHKEYYEKIIDGQVRVLKSVLDASDGQISDYEWMLKTIYQYGIYPFAFGRLENALVTSFGLMQVPDEFARFCNFIGNLKVKTAMELGVFKGRSSYFISALLSRKNPKLKYYMVDICDSLDSFERFREILPFLEKKIPSQSSEYAGRKFDFVLIDADHSYSASMQDYLNVGRYAEKVVCFHDIYAHEYDALDGGMVRTWKEVQKLEDDKRYKIFSHYPDRWMGIGCVLRGDN